MIKKTKVKRKSNAGRKSELTVEVRRKIDECAQLGSSMEEIAFWCDVHRATLFRWVQKDEKLRNRIEHLQQRPILMARQTIVNNLGNNPEIAFKFLERKRREEFSPRNEIAMTGEIVNKHSIDPEQEALMKNAMGNFASKLKKLAVAVEDKK